MPPARLEARMDSLFSFPVGLFHPQQHAGLSRRTPVSRPSGRSAVDARIGRVRAFLTNSSHWSAQQNRPLCRAIRELVFARDLVECVDDRYLHFPLLLLSGRALKNAGFCRVVGRVPNKAEAES